MVIHRDRYLVCTVVDYSFLDVSCVSYRGLTEEIDRRELKWWEYIIFKKEVQWRFNQKIQYLAILYQQINKVLRYINCSNDLVIIS